jgi:hypothetical protein
MKLSVERTLNAKQHVGSFTLISTGGRTGWFWDRREFSVWGT